MPRALSGSFTIHPHVHTFWQSTQTFMHSRTKQKKGFLITPFHYIHIHICWRWSAFSRKWHHWIMPFGCQCTPQLSVCELYVWLFAVCCMSMKISAPALIPPVSDSNSFLNLWVSKLRLWRIRVHSEHVTTEYNQCFILRLGTLSYEPFRGFHVLKTSDVFCLLINDTETCLPVHGQ